MQSASREALSTLRTRVESVVSGLDADAMSTLAEQLYAVAELFSAQPRLRRRVADPAVATDARSGLATVLLQGKIAENTLRIVTAAVSLRWSSAWDLVDALETSGDGVLLAAADEQGVIDSVEDELFRLERILDVESALTTLLDESTAEPRRRAELVEQLLGNKVHPVTVALVRHAVVSGRKRSVLLAIDDLIEAAGARRQRSVARVFSAVDLTDQQQGALAAQLSKMYGRRIEVRYAVDPSVRGGLVVHVGDEIIDGSVASRLSQIRSAFAG